MRLIPSVSGMQKRDPKKKYTDRASASESATYMQTVQIFSRFSNFLFSLRTAGEKTRYPLS